MKANSSENETYYEYYYDENLIRQCHMEDFSVITGISFIIIFCISFLGNSILIYGLIRLKSIRRVTMMFLLSLAGFDVLFTLTLPFWAVDHLHQWIFGEPACQMLTGAYFVGIYGSLILLTAMTVDRFVVVVVRSQWFTQRRRQICASVAIVGSWIISIGGCMKDALASKVVNSNISTCYMAPSHDDKPEYYTQLFLLFVFPVIIIILCYGVILHKLMSTPGRRNYWTVLVILAIVVAFVTCWGPYHVLMILIDQIDQKNCEVIKKHHQAFLVCRILAYSHCCVNSLLFLLRERFRRIFSSYLFCSPRLRSFNQQDEPSEPSQPSFYQHHFNMAYQQHNTEIKTLGES